MDETQTFPDRILSIIQSAVLSGLKTTLLLARIMIPVSLAVALLTWTGLLPLIADLLAPGMRMLGLPGEAALVLVSSVFLNVYSAIAVIEMLSLSMREITILAIMTVTAHNLLVETAVMKKAGSSAVKMILLRLGWAVVLGWTLNSILPPTASLGAAFAAAPARQAFLSMLASWGLSTLGLMVKILMLVCGIMVAQRLMEELRVTYFLSRLLSPLMRFFGLSTETSLLWIVVNTAGYSYGAAVIMDKVHNGKMKPRDADQIGRAHV